MTQREAGPLIQDPDWDEDEQLEEWRRVLRNLDGLPPVLQAILALDTWNELAVLHRAPWPGRLLVASLLRRDRLTTQTGVPPAAAGPADAGASPHRQAHFVSLPELIELVLSKPLVSAGMIASELGVTQRAALRLVEELGLREMTGRGSLEAVMYLSRVEQLV